MGVGRFPLLALSLFLVSNTASLSQDSIPPALYDQVAAAFQQGRVQEAEQLLRSALAQHPASAGALTLLAVILDAQKRYQEAEQSYLQALKLGPKSAALFNNLGNHYVARALPEKAWKAYLEVLELEPFHPNANLQLAQLSVNQGDGAQALKHLERLPKEDREAPAVKLVEIRALHSANDPQAARQLLADLESRSENDARLAFSIGMLYVEWQQFADAERAFAGALKADPANFDILYNLALAANRAGHLERAEEAFGAALRQRPDDADCLYGLAHVYAQKEQDYAATALLLRAQRMAPERPDIPLLLAQLSRKLGFFADAVTAYNDYLKLRPEDEKARQERALALVRIGKLRDGIQDLEDYVKRHPDEAPAWYALGLAETIGDRNKSLEYMTRALELDPNLLSARFARARLYAQLGMASEAVKDLELFLEREPENVQALDQLGQSYLLLGQADKAARLLRQALEKDPKNPGVLFHYSRALRRLGQREEAERVAAQFKQARSEEKSSPKAGLFEYLSLSPAEQQAQYLENLRQSAKSTPNDGRVQLRLAAALINAGRKPEALDILREIPVVTDDPALLAEAGALLLDCEEYKMAGEYLRSTVSADPSLSEAQINLAIAVFHTAGPEQGLAALDRIPAEQQRGDYFLLRAQMLDAAGRFPEAVTALNRGFRAAPTRADLYSEAAFFLIKHRRYQECLQLLNQAAQLLPNQPQLMLTQAVTLELLKRPDEAQKLLDRIQSLWPEWHLPYLLRGIILESRLFSEDAKIQLETAVSLGSADPAAYYYLALAIEHTTPDDTEGIGKAISRALELSPEDPYIQLLAGKYALRRKDYAAAQKHLTAAIRFEPDLADAHYALSATYRGSGDARRAEAELKEAQRLEKEISQEEQGALSIRDVLFSVRAPRRGGH